MRELCRAGGTVVAAVVAVLEKQQQAVNDHIDHISTAANSRNLQQVRGVGHDYEAQIFLKLALNFQHETI